MNVVFVSALLAGLYNVGFEPMGSRVLSVAGVVSGLPLPSALWSWSGICTKMVGGAVVLWGLLLELEEVLQEPSESVASVGSGGRCSGWCCLGAALLLVAALLLLLLL